MSKKIVFCADGTWDTANSRTNVYLFYKSLSVTGDQMPFYDDGVGSEGAFILKVVEGAIGAGIQQKIKDGYTKIAQVYEEGDQIFIVGFSRGAYTARSLAGMIADCGLPTKNFSTDLVNTVFQAYRDPHNRANILKKLADCSMFPAQITMVGVWDTVGSLGLTAALGGVDPVVSFLDTNLHPNMLHAYHALAIDEKRPQFQPTLWNTPMQGQTLEQVWFSGFHCDVGGGAFPRQAGVPALSDIPLAWMMSKAAALGLQFDPLVTAALPFPVDQSYAVLPMHPPNDGIGQIELRSIADGARLADSVVIRCQNPNLRPHNIKFVNGALSPTYGIENVVRQLQSAAGSMAS